MKTELATVIKEGGELSPKEVKYLIGKSNPVIIEVGANIGQTTAEFIKEMPSATIYCFEPDPRAIHEFKKNISSPNVHLIESAVGNENGTIVFNQSTGTEEYEGWNQSGSIRKPKEHTKIWPKVTFLNSLEVPIVRLDDWAATVDIPFVDFIWADTQGAESDLILGGLNTLNKARYFYTEYGFQELYDGQITLEEIDRLLQNFSISRIFDADVLFRNITFKEQDFVQEFEIPKVRRNKRCLCGSGKRYDECHGVPRMSWSKLKKLATEFFNSN
jgi:FkbM family methyltransferase